MGMEAIKSEIKSEGQRKIRVLVAKPGLDGHDRGAKVIARALRDAGMEVVYTGIRRTPGEIVEAAIEEDAKVIGLSCLSGAHMVLFSKVIELLKEKDAEDIAVIGGGIIPEEDKVKLEKIGIKKIFGPGSSLDEIVNFIKGLKN
jgi:methylmalonyl-CoA mutase C-terminal domain/subunit